MVRQELVEFVALFNRERACRMAVRSSPEAVSSRTPRLMRRVMPRSWAISARANRLASSTMTVRTPLPSMRSRSGAKPARVSIGSAPETAAS